MKILIVEDEPKTVAYLRKGLTEQGYAVDFAGNGEDGLHLAQTLDYDAVVLDGMLPGLDGVEVLERLRQTRQTPVIMLTARDSVDDRLKGLGAGADDYLVKPFAIAELQARINALARRPPPQEVQTQLQVADLQMDLLKRVVRRAGRRIELQPREFQLLEYLMRHAGRVVTRTMLLEGVWDFHFDPRTNIVETHMSRLRAKVDKGHASELIHTVRGAGYCLREPD